MLIPWRVYNPIHLQDVPKFQLLAFCMFCRVFQFLYIPTEFGEALQI